MLPSSFLRIVLPVSLCTGYAHARSSFNIEAHGTGVRYTSAGQVSADGIDLTNGDNAFYTVNIMLGGQSFTVQLDTGSTDLWVYTGGKDVKFTNTTNLDAHIQYAKGQVDGLIQFAELRFGDFTIPNQVFINATSVADISLDNHQGIMGMGILNSMIQEKFSSAWGEEAAFELGRASISNIFAQYPKLPNNFDVLLGRTSDLEDVAGGVFVISDHEEGFESITSAPKLPVLSSIHWDVVMDAMLVNGKSFAFNKSRVSGVPSGKLVAMLDTGFTFPPIPPAAVDAIYSTIPGAMQDPYMSGWVVPCDTSTNLTFVFAGQEFPVHPLDLTYTEALSYPWGGIDVAVTVCRNAYQASTLDPQGFPDLDLILGDSFLRNVYASFDYGDYYPGNQTTSSPFVQMLSVTDPSSMWEEFQVERAVALAQLAPTVDPAFILEVEKVLFSSQSDSDEDQDSTAAVAGAVASSDGDSPNGDSWGAKYGTVALGLLAANLLVGVVLLGVTVTMCVRGVKGRSVGSRYAPVRFKDNVDEFERGPLTYGS